MTRAQPTVKTKLSDDGLVIKVWEPSANVSTDTSACQHKRRRFNEIRASIAELQRCWPHRSEADVAGLGSSQPLPS